MLVQNGLSIFLELESLLEIYYIKKIMARYLVIQKSFVLGENLQGLPQLLPITAHQKFRLWRCGH
jgi:hypothetical protein